MRFQIVSGFLIYCLVMMSANAESHKIVDKDGNITFSQFPPLESVEASELRSARAEINQAELRHGRQYCGDIYLPSANALEKTKQEYAKYIDEQKLLWLTRLVRVNQEVLTVTETQFQRNKKAQTALSKHRHSDNTLKNAQDERIKQNLNRQMTDLYCAIAWADEQHEKLLDAQLADN